MALKTLTHDLPANVQQQCLLFELPPELRNLVYEMAFDFQGQPGHCHPCNTVNIGRTSDHRHSDNCGDLLGSIVPPSFALAQSCQRIYHESKSIFKIAFEAYWEQTFSIDYTNDTRVLPYIRSVPDGYLRQIRKFDFVVEYEFVPFVVSWEWLDRKWKVEVPHYQEELEDESDPWEYSFKPWETEILHTMLSFSGSELVLNARLNGRKIVALIRGFRERERERECWTEVA